MKRLTWIVSAGGCALIFLASRGLSQNPAPQAVPFRTSDGKVTGWRINIPGNRPLASPAIAEGKIFVGGGFGSHEFYAFDAATGQHLWTYHTADDGPTAAVVEGGRIAFNTESCELEIITTSGRPVWKKWLGDPLMSMPAIADGVVYMAYPESRGDNQYHLAAFDLATGKQLWKAAIGSEIITAPVIERDRVYAATVGGAMVALNRTDGKLLWQENQNATSAPAVWNGQAYFSRSQDLQVQRGGRAMAQKTEMLGARPVTAGAQVKDMTATRQDADYLDYAKSAATPAGVASEALDASVGFAGPSKGAAPMAMAKAQIGKATVHGIWAYQGSKAFVDNGRLYSAMGDTARSVDPGTGKVIWAQKVQAPKALRDAPMLTPPAIVNGKLFVGSSAGEVYALSEKGGEILWKADLGEPVSFQPSVANGHLYVTTDRGSLFCLNTGDARDHGWLMWGGTPAHNGLSGR
jgi:Ca-activated chloride channel family protein